MQSWDKPGRGTAPSGAEFEEKSRGIVGPDCISRLIHRQVGEREKAERCQLAFGVAGTAPQGTAVMVQLL